MKNANDYLREWRINHPENILLYNLKKKKEREVQKEIQNKKDEEFNKRIIEFGIKHREKYPQLY